MIKKTTYIFITLVVIFFIVGVSRHSYAVSKIGPGYSVTNFNSLITSLLTSYTSSDRPDNFIDGYARMFHCSLVEQNITNEFKWIKIRENLNTEIDRLDREYFLHYEFSGPIKLGKYDFQKGTFPLKNDSTMVNVGFLSMYRFSGHVSDKKYCGDFFYKIQEKEKAPIGEYLPEIFLIKLRKPITITDIKVDQDSAKKFVANISKKVDDDRIVHIRFRVKISGLYKTNVSDYRASEVIFNASLKEVDIFLDEDLTKHFASIKF